MRFSRLPGNALGQVVKQYYWAGSHAMRLDRSSDTAIAQYPTMRSCRLLDNVIGQVVRQCASAGCQATNFCRLSGNALGQVARQCTWTGCQAMRLAGCQTM